MRFDLVDRVIEQSAERIVTVKGVSAAEEYLQDHFPGFPVLPGVMMIEAMVQAGRRLLDTRGGSGEEERGRLVLGGVRAVKYGRFVRPGETMRIEVSLIKALDRGAYELKGEATVLRAWEQERRPGAEPCDAGGERRSAVSGRFTLRPVRLGLPASVG